MRLFVILLGLVLTALAAPFLLPIREQALEAGTLPWQVEALPGGQSKALGLILPTSSLADARARFGPDVELGLVVDAAGEPSLEAYFPSIRLGFITGKLIANAWVSPREMEELVARSPDSQAMRSGARKFRLAAEDAESAWQKRIRGLVFVPSAELSAQTIRERFGEPHERVAESEAIEHWLYPDRGIDLVLDSDDKDAVQYVAPSAFEELRGKLPGLASAQ